MVLGRKTIYLSAFTSHFATSSPGIHFFLKILIVPSAYMSRIALSIFSFSGEPENTFSNALHCVKFDLHLILPTFLHSKTVKYWDKHISHLIKRASFFLVQFVENGRFSNICKISVPSLLDTFFHSGSKH